MIHAVPWAHNEVGEGTILRDGYIYVPEQAWVWAIRTLLPTAYQWFAYERLVGARIFEISFNSSIESRGSAPLPDDSRPLLAEDFPVNAHLLNTPPYPQVHWTFAPQDFFDRIGLTKAKSYLTVPLVRRESPAP